MLQSRPNAGEILRPPSPFRRKHLRKIPFSLVAQWTATLSISLFLLDSFSCKNLAFVIGKIKDDIAFKPSQDDELGFSSSEIFSKSSEAFFPAALRVGATPSRGVKRRGRGGISSLPAGSRAADWHWNFE